MLWIFLIHLHDIKRVELKVDKLASKVESNNWSCLNMVVDARTS
jgi:hypothetical protein